MTTDGYPKLYLYKRIVRAKLFIDNNYADKIDLDCITSEANFSKFHFIRLFRTIYGKTPHQYLKAVRIEKAIQLLKANEPVKQVCFSVGFDSLSSFSGLFKRVVGQSPSSYSSLQHSIREQSATTPLAFVPGCFASQHGWNEKAISEK